MVSEERSSSTTQPRESLSGVVPRHPSTGAGKAAENPSIHTIESFEETHGNGDHLRSVGDVPRQSGRSARSAVKATPLEPEVRRMEDAPTQRPKRPADVRSREAGRPPSVQIACRGRRLAR
jgi:hypothetical protein